MELKDEQLINAPRAQVYAALNDPEILRQCIPGCETLEKTSDTEMNATVTLKVGPVKAKFSGAVTLSNLNPPSGYTITGEGKGGPAGFAKGGADIELVEQPGGATLLKYDVKANVGGKIAQLGSRLIVSTSRKLAGQFFEKFADLVGTEAATDEAVPAESETPASAPKPEEPAAAAGGNQKLIWLAIAAAAIAAIWYFSGQAG